MWVGGFGCEHGELAFSKSLNELNLPGVVEVVRRHAGDQINVRVLAFSGVLVQAGGIECGDGFPQTLVPVLSNSLFVR